MFGKRKVTITNSLPAQDAYRRNLPDSYLFKFFQEAQNHFGVKTWAAEELGNLPVKPLKAGHWAGALVECIGNCVY